MEQNEIIEGSRFYIASLKWTHKKDDAITLWRANGAGYCWFQEWAGIYSEAKATCLTGNETSFKVEIKSANHLFRIARYDGVDRIVLPNTAEVRQALNLPLKKFGASHRSCYMALNSQPIKP